MLIYLTFLPACSANAAESKEVKIKRALSPAPANIAAGAKVVDIDQKGNMRVLRNGFIQVSLNKIHAAKWRPELVSCEGIAKEGG